MQPSNLEDRLAVIDLGSNTFHLLIVQKKAGSPGFECLYRERQFIYLSSDGIDVIPEYKVDEALFCLNNFALSVKKHNCSKVIAVGTAALRSSSNGKHILQRIKRETGFEVKLISGGDEAKLIYEGSRMLGLDYPGNGLIMDIGGGSVEFIIVNGDMSVMHDHKSFNIGISVLRKKFQMSEPLSLMDRHKLADYLDDLLLGWLATCKKYEPCFLLGSSGPFEIIESMKGDESSVKGNAYPVDSLENEFLQVLKNDKEGRLALTGMPSHRADLAKESFLLIQYVLENLGTIREIIVSPFAIKEGLIKKGFSKT